jgi:outer membrane protein assembly factor BamB
MLALTIFALLTQLLCTTGALPYNSPYTGPACAGPDAGFGFNRNSDSYSWREPIPAGSGRRTSDVSSVAVSSDRNMLYAKIDYGNVSAWQLAAPHSLLWTRDIGRCSSTYFAPTLTADERTLLVACTHNIYDPNGPSNLFALNAMTGEIMWNVSANGYYMSTPTLGADGAIFSVIRTTDGSGGLLVLEADGSPRFAYNDESMDASGMQPALSPDGSTVYVTGGLIGGSIGSGRLFAISTATGAASATFNTTTKIRGSPTVALDGTIIVGLECE